MDEPTRILVADDSPSVTLLLSRALETSGFEVTSVADGHAAYEEGRSGNYQLVVLDHFMPGMLGTEIIQRWRDEGLTMPVIVLSGVQDDETIVQSLELGATDFVRKPFNVKELVVRVRAQLPR
jgi:two-component system, OmpR family, KDP operon response regulator KdpE